MARGFASFRRAYRGDQVETGTAVAASSPSAPQPADPYPSEAPFREAKQAVDLTPGRDHRSPWAVASEEQKNIAIAQALAGCPRRRNAASRPICDAAGCRWSARFGSTAQTVRPQALPRLGISGAIQHLVGMKGSKNIIAVNKTPKRRSLNRRRRCCGHLFGHCPRVTEEVKKAKA